MKKYRLKKDLPGLKKGLIIEDAPAYGTIISISSCGTYDQESINPSDYPDWFEEVPERIELEPQYGRNGVIVGTQKANETNLRPDELDLMEQALNGELYSMNQLKEMFDDYDTSMHPIDWLKNKKS